MVTRRPDGTLEQEIMAVLWAAKRPLLPAEINERLGRPLAYTTVATVLGRLLAKSMVERTPAGRAFAYRAAIDESQFAAGRIADVLASTSDRSKVLVSFVGSLSDRDARLLRRLLRAERD